MKQRGVAQPGSALGLGPRGRMFESSRPDQSLFLIGIQKAPISPVFFAGKNLELSSI